MSEPNNNLSNQIIYLTPKCDFLIRMSNPETGEPIVSIKPDGTVEIHQEGGDKEAARVFYEALHIEGTTLHQKVAALTKRVATLEGAIKYVTNDLAYRPPEMVDKDINERYYKRLSGALSGP